MYALVLFIIYSIASASAYICLNDGSKIERNLSFATIGPVFLFLLEAKGAWQAAFNAIIYIIIAMLLIYILREKLGFVYKKPRIPLLASIITALAYIYAIT